MHYPIRSAPPPSSPPSSPQTLRRLYSLIHTSNKAGGPTNMLSEARTVKRKTLVSMEKQKVRGVPFIKVCTHSKKLLLSIRFSV